MASEIGKRPAAGDRAALILLAAGAAIGLVTAAVALLNPGRTGANKPPLGAAVLVNHVPISKDIYNRELIAMANDSKAPLTRAQRDFVLKRLIEEELLVQRGLELGMAEREKAVRAAIVRAVIGSVTAEVDGRPVDEKTLRRFYHQNAELFTTSDRLRVAAATVAGLDAARALRKRARSGASIGAERATPVSRSSIFVPDALLPLDKLRDYLGPTAARRAAALAVGETTRPLRQGASFVVVQLLERKPGRLLPFELVRRQVEGAYRRHAGDRALEEYLARLARRAKIVRAPETR